MKLTPRSMAWLSAAREVLSSVDPQSFPPIPHAPKPIADIFQPVRPKARYSMFSTLSAKIVSLRVVYSNGMAFCKKRGLTPALSTQWRGSRGCGRRPYKDTERSRQQYPQGWRATACAHLTLSH